MSEPVIEASKLEVVYNKGKSNEIRTLRDVSAKIFPGEFVIVFGPSGCGKSTFLNCISGLQTPTSGEVFIKGKKLSEMSKKELVHIHQSVIGMIFQSFCLISSLTVLDNVCLPKVFLGESREKREEKGFQLLHRFSVVEQSGKLPSQLSGGQRQRVSIARALVNDTEVVIADEPVGNLDSESSKNVLNILKDLNEIDKKTIILVTHNAEHLSFADRVIHIRDGQVLKEDVFNEKRPDYVYVEKSKIRGEDETEKLSPDLRILMKTFKNLSAGQIGSLLVPFKTNQLMSHVLTDFTKEQLDTAEAYLKELLFENIDVGTFEKNLDKDYKKGGAGWNKKRAQSFSQRVGRILEQTKILRTTPEGESVASIAGYLADLFKFSLGEEVRLRLELLIRQRIQNKIDQEELRKKLDAGVIIGGVGLHKKIAEKASREIEIIILMKYTA